MARAGLDGADGIFWDGPDRGWCVQLRPFTKPGYGTGPGKDRGAFRRYYLDEDGKPMGKKSDPIKAIAKRAAPFTPSSGLFVFPFSRGARGFDGSITIENRKVISATAATS
jgi:hypothetical protein